jgi:hypothetical protein
MKGAFLMAETKQEVKTPVVREYTVGDTRYIVKATVKDGATEDAATKIRRLIRNDIGSKNTQKSDV